MYTQHAKCKLWTLQIQNFLVGFLLLSIYSTFITSATNVSHTGILSMVIKIVQYVNKFSFHFHQSLSIHQGFFQFSFAEAFLSCDNIYFDSRNKDTTRQTKWVLTVYITCIRKTLQSKVYIFTLLTNKQITRFRFKRIHINLKVYKHYFFQSRVKQRFKQTSNSECFNNPFVVEHLGLQLFIFIFKLFNLYFCVHWSAMTEMGRLQTCSASL